MLSLLQVQCSMGYSDYIQRDEALRNLIQPLAGEYGMHNGEPQGEPVQCIDRITCVGSCTLPAWWCGMHHRWPQAGMLLQSGDCLDGSSASYKTKAVFPTRHKHCVPACWIS